ncbi:hypothetical protein PR001_g18745 [Phytophthora rubi]|uniref:Uncharacterized protein n=1 Tax=Phytophthora rubi TaxID=129364 RepID=A0A6A3K355_9STRA|nr:hypothetical protein PR001_g18745 [Phytophthora rubi]
MARLVHSTVHWSARCILDSSSEEENVQRGGAQAPAESAKSSSPGSTSSTGTSTPPLDVAPARPPHPEGGVKSSPDEGFDGWRLGAQGAHGVRNGSSYACNPAAHTEPS